MRAAVAHGNSVRTTSGLEPLEGRLRSFRKERGWTPCAGRDSGNRDADPPRPADLTSFDPPLPHCPGSRPALARSVVDLRRGPLRRTRPRGLSLALVIPATAARGRACRTREGVRARTASSPTGNGGESLAPVCRWCFRPGETVHAARSRTMMGKATPLTGAGTRSGPGPRPGAPPRYPGVGRGGALVSRSSPDWAETRWGSVTRSGIERGPDCIGRRHYASTIAGRHAWTSPLISPSKPKALA